MWRAINVVAILVTTLAIIPNACIETYSMISEVNYNYTYLPLETKYMKKCNIIIEGKGYSCWLSGISMNNKTFISIAMIHIIEGKTQISSIKNPDENYIFKGEQLILMTRYIGYYHSNHEYPPSIIYNGTAFNALIITK